MESDRRNDEAIQDSEIIDLREIFNLFLERKKLIAYITTSFSILSIIIALMMPNQYSSTATLIPSQNKSAVSSSSGLSSQFGGLASLAGINISSGGASSEADVAFQIMQSWAFIEKFINDSEIGVYLMAAEGWESSSNKIKIDSSIYDLDKKTWTSISKNYKGEYPSSWSLYQAFKNRTSIKKDNLTGTITISFEFYSPFKAKEIIELYIQSINDFMRDRKLESTSKNIEYLENELQKTSIARMREIFFKLIEEQKNMQMLAQATPDYVFDIVSKPMVSEDKSSPARSLLVLSFTISAFFLSLLFVIVDDKFKLMKNRKNI